MPITFDLLPGLRPPPSVAFLRLKSQIRDESSNVYSASGTGVLLDRYLTTPFRFVPVCQHFLWVLVLFLSALRCGPFLPTDCCSAAEMSANPFQDMVENIVPTMH